MSIESLKMPVTPADVHPMTRTRTMDRSMNRESMILGLGAFLVSAIFAIILVFRYHIVYGDALTRVLNAYYVVFRGNLHVAGIGFVWNPFPSIFELPFVMLHGLWNLILVDALPANMVSSIFAGISVYYGNRIFQLLGISRPFRIVWSILFLLNPMMLLYGANGMSDSMMIGAFIAATEGALRFYKNRNLSAMISTGIWLAVGLGLRYEAVPFATFLIAGLAIAMWRDKVGYSKIEGTIAVLLFPIVSAGIVWMILNWMIMRDPLYFLNSQYGNSAQIAQGTYTTGLTAYADGNMWHALVAAFGFTRLFIPIAITVPLVFIIAVFSRRHHDGWIIALAAISVPLFQMYLLYKNTSAGWARFFIEFIPFGFISAAFLGAAALRRGRMIPIVGVLVTVLLLAGDGSTLWTLNNKVYGHGDSSIVRLVEHNRQSPANAGYVGQSVLMVERTQALNVATYINSHPKLRVLFDNFSDYLIVPDIRHPEQIILTNDTDFMSVLLNPRGRINAFLVPENYGVSKLNAINVAYPTLWEGRVPWARLVKQFPGRYQYKLYEITSSAP